ncbi:MAG: threonine synthase [Firmicutes bacterium]|nr:threonine synthase [Bacillota bacterium]
MYISTRGGNSRFTAAAAIKTGLAPDGGLLVPQELPTLDNSFLNELTALNYHQRAAKILKLFLDDYSESEIDACLKAAYNNIKFNDAAVAPVVKLNDEASVLELWHGPTSAFKDMALQLLPQLLSLALKKTGETAKIVILVATSGDTGKAALEGFADVVQTQIVVFYPHHGVSKIQELQMVTQEGGNVAVAAVKGNFDDTQTGVKLIFNDQGYRAKLEQQGFKLSSANSINWGRLLPQIVYYFSAYADLINQGTIKPKQSVNFVVPTGNFGNILAGYYAKLMGLPINKLICAANNNNVLTEFLRTGIYNRQRDFYKTLSPSMDILISSNLERLLYLVTGDSDKVASWMQELTEQGRYQVDAVSLKAIQQNFWSDWASDELTIETIKDVFDQYHYVMDPHTAVAWRVYTSYRQQTGDTTPTVVVSTASPFKFSESVLTAIAGKGSVNGKNEFDVLRELSRLTGWSIPVPLANLENKEIRHTTVGNKEDMPIIVKQALNR